MGHTERYCPFCETVVTVEQPPCPDGHDECPDQACTRCGTALFAGIVDAVARFPLSPSARTGVA